MKGEVLGTELRSNLENMSDDAVDKILAIEGMSTTFRMYMAEKLHHIIIDG